MVRHAEVYLVARLGSLWAGFPKKQSCPVGDCVLAEREAMPPGTGTWLPDGLSRLRGCRGAAGRSQCAPCPPVHRDVQQLMWADFASASRWAMEVPDPLPDASSKEMKSQKGKTHG